MPVEAPPPGSGVLKGRSILVLDDEESIRMLLDEGLSAQGLLVDCAATPAEAMESAGRRSYHTLLCDLNLSHGGSATMDGREAARQILSAAGTSEPAVIFMTGDMVDTIESRPGEPRHLQKPFRVSEVLAVLRRFSPPFPPKECRSECLVLENLGLDEHATIFPSRSYPAVT